MSEAVEAVITVDLDTSVHTWPVDTLVCTEFHASSALIGRVKVA